MADEVEVTLFLTHDQALVLFEWLSREDNKCGLPTVHRAEQMVLWKIAAQLERMLVEPLRPDYVALVSAARERLICGDGPKR